MEKIEWDIDDQERSELDDVLDSAYFSEIEEEDELDEDDWFEEILTSDHLLREL